MKTTNTNENGKASLQNRWQPQKPKRKNDQTPMKTTKLKIACWCTNADVIMLV